MQYRTFNGKAIVGALLPYSFCFIEAELLCFYANPYYEIKEQVGVLYDSFLIQSQVRLPKGKMLLGNEEQIIIKVAFKLNKTLTELEKEPLNYILAMYYSMQFEEQMDIASKLIEYLTNKATKKQVL